MTPPNHDGDGLEAYADDTNRRRTLDSSSGRLGNGSTSFEDAELMKCLRKSPKQVPCSYLYDSKGTELYNQITELEEYYPYRTELAMLRSLGKAIASHIPQGAILVELGCGCARKSAVLLKALLAGGSAESCTYVGIDVSADFLQQARANLLDACPDLRPEKVQMIQADYLEGLKEARSMHPEAVLCVLWLGSSVGNLTAPEAITFFKDILAISGPQTEVLLGADLWKEKEVLHAAYCDSRGVTRAFIQNGVANALKAALRDATPTDVGQWEYEVVVNEQKLQVEMYVAARDDLELPGGITIHRGERILAEVSCKFKAERLYGLAFSSGFCLQAQWRANGYCLLMLSAPPLAFELAWQESDALFKGIQDWSVAPIPLRHPFSFYYAHNTSFAKLTLLPGLEASPFDVMFSRGVDPDVANPENCHMHPEVPPVWPAIPDVVAYVNQRRHEIGLALSCSQVGMHQIWLSLEHEHMHQETLSYMKAQYRKQLWEADRIKPGSRREPPLPPCASCQEAPAIAAPGGDLHVTTGSSSVEDGSSWESDGLALVPVPGGEICQGIATDGSAGFVWDNEGPRQAPQWVAPFEAAAHPVSVGEFREFVLAGGYATTSLWVPGDLKAVEASGGMTCPATWSLSADREVWVHFPEGSHHWSEVQDRPVWCSLAEARAYCAWRGCRLMTELEYESLISSDPDGHRVHQLQGGGWEWTDTVFGPLPGFKPLEDYPVYSQDFFDGLHYVLRGSCAPYTHPSLLRPSFRNFYQAAYPYVFAKFRCCR